MNTVTPADLFALIVIAPAVGDRNFIDAVVLFCDFRGDLRLEIEAVAFDGDALENVRLEDFVADFHIRQVEIGEHI